TCLQREPQRRYPDASKLRDALADYLAGLGFSRVGEELVSFFADPASYRKLARQRIVAALLERSERLLADKRTPRALGCINHVLALDANNARALALLKGLQRAQRIKTWRRRGLRLGLGLAASAVLGVGGWKAHQASSARQDPAAPLTPDNAGALTPAVPGPRPRDAAPGAEPRGTDLADRNGTSVSPAPGQPAVTPDRNGTSIPPAVGGTPRPSPPRAPSGAGVAEDAAPKKPLVRKLPVSILVRPYGVVRVDGDAPSPQPLQKHDLRLAPGPHTVTISCEYCEDVVETIHVSEDGKQEFHLGAQPKASRLSLDFQPAEATVRVGDQLRTAGESLQQPFEVRSPRGPADLQHTVVVELFHPGFRSERRVVRLKPGESTVLRGSLLPE
ncbi:MAG TPA: serine/threonine protein kinase, partial [Myxococcus sp.]|nr:serine/threonine protein kinase [Myxococcus sp.]